MTHPNTSHCRYHSEKSARWYCKPCRLPLCTSCKPYAEQLPLQVKCPLCGQALQERTEATDPLEPLRTAARNALSPPLLAIAACFGLVGALGFGSLAGTLLALPVGAALLYCMIMLTRRAGEGHDEPPSLRQLVDIEQIEYGLQLLPIGLVFAALFGIALVKPSSPLALLLIVAAAGSLPIVQLSAIVFESPGKAFNPACVSRVLDAAKGPLALVSLLFVLAASALTAVSSLSGTGATIACAMLAFAAGTLALGLSTQLGAIARAHRRVLEYPAGVAPIDRPRPPEPATYEPAQFAADADILKRENRLQEARQLLGSALTRYPDDRTLSARFDQLIYETAKPDEFRSHLERRMQRLVRNGQTAAAAELWQRYSPRLDDWVPRLSDTRYRLALELDLLGDHQTAFRLLMTLPPDERKFRRIAEAWMEAARILEERLDDRKRAAELRRVARERFPERAREWLQCWGHRHIAEAAPPSSAATAAG